MSRKKKQNPGHVLITPAKLDPDGKEIEKAEYRPNRRLKREQESSRGKRKRQKAFAQFLQQIAQKYIKENNDSSN